MAQAPSPCESIIRAFTAQFGSEPTLFAQAPGRVNLIGEHTDYNEGLVLPVAISRRVVIAGRPSPGGTIRLYASAFEEIAEFPAIDPGGASVPRWARYPQGVAVELTRRFPLAGLEAVVAGDLPIGSGLSSSAALEVACSLASEHAAGRTLAPRERALLCHTAEVEFVGVPCGIMDQFASALSRKGQALFIDCRSQETHHIALPQELVIAVCDTGVRRSLSDSSYAERRRECDAAVAGLRSHRSSITSLRDVTVDDLDLIEELPDPLRRRARHVVTENARVVQASQALESGETERLRDVFAASHQSLRNDYEVSSPELDAMVEAALASPGCVAARMTGAGFGGSAVALVQRSVQERFMQAVALGYQTRTKREGAFFVTQAADGAGTLELG